MNYRTEGTDNPNHAQIPKAPGATSQVAGFRRSFKDDFMASIVVFLVAMPLCMGIAIASGIPPERAAATGIITGIIGGLVVGFLAGSPLQVSGPAAGLSVIIMDLINNSRISYILSLDPQYEQLNPASPEAQALYAQGTEHALKVLGVAVLLAGLMQFGAGLLRWGRWFRAVSPAVIQGMLAGIGVLILASQFHVMIDDRPQGKGGGLANLLTIPNAILKAVFPEEGYGSAHFQAACVGVLTILTIVLWKAFGPKKLKFLPAPLVGVIVGTTAFLAGGLAIQRISMAGGLVEVIHFPTPDVIQEVWSWSLLGTAAALAIIASAETLLCATAVDRLHRGPRTQYDRELTAQGVGNTLCGLVGVLPMTGVIVRSATNLEAGGKTRASAIMHGLWLLVFAAALPFTLELIPIAALAGVLVYTGWKLVNVQAIRNLWRYGWSEVGIYAATLVGIVVFDLLKGILIGVALAVVKLLYRVSHLDIQVDENRQERVTMLRLDGAATFVRLPLLAAALEKLRPDTTLHVNFQNLTYIDHACIDLLMNWEKQNHEVGGRLVLDWDSLTARFYRKPNGGPALPVPSVDGHVSARSGERALVGAGAGETSGHAS